MSKRGRPKGQWSERNLQILERLKAGVARKVIAAEFGLSGKRIDQLAQELGLPRVGPEPWPKELSRRAQRLRAQGLSSSMIASRLGVTKHAVTGHLRRVALQKRIGDQHDLPHRPR